jgi:hypothetical protein
MATKPPKRTRKPHAAFAPKTQMRLERVDDYDRSSKSMLPLLDALYLNQHNEIVGVAPCGEECILAVDQNELSPIIAFLTEAKGHMPAYRP